MKCKAKTQNGQPCRMSVLKDSKYCFTHSPAHRAQQAQARRKGGENRHTPHFADPAQLPANMATLEDASKLLTYTLTEVIGHDNSIARARVLLALYDSFVKSFEIGELEKRIQALEQGNNGK